MRTMSHTVLICFNLIQMHMFAEESILLSVGQPISHHHTYKWVILYIFWYIVIRALSGLQRKEFENREEL